MKPSDQIKSEHRAIGKALSSLRAIAVSAREDRELPTVLLDHELEFIRGFTEEFHHRKEEAVLFPALARQLRGVSIEPLSLLLSEHVRLRSLLDQLRTAIGAYAAGETTSASEIAVLADEFADLSVEHMRKENVILIDLIENNLPPDKKLEVSERFLAIEEEFGPGYSERYEGLADDLRDEGRRMAA